MKQKKIRKTAISLGILLMYLALCPLFITTGGRLPENKTVVRATVTPVPSATVTPEPTPSGAEGTATPEPTISPTPTPVPTPTPRALPMDTFDTGSVPKKSGFTEDGYEDESISVKIGHETIDGVRYNYAHVKIAHPSQFRTALGGSPEKARYAGFIKISDRSNAVIAINGDFYYNRSGAYIVRQSQILRNQFKSELDILLVDYDGNFHLYHGADAKAGIQEMQGDIYQAFAFGPALVIDGELCTDLRNDYDFGANTRNPRTAIGQLGELEYLLVVVDGRTNKSKGVIVQTMGEYMHSKGCIQAFNLDGGSSSGMYIDGEVYNLTTGKGVRSLYDVIYFASTAEEADD